MLKYDGDPKCKSSYFHFGKVPKVSRDIPMDEDVDPVNV